MEISTTIMCDVIFIGVLLVAGAISNYDRDCDRKQNKVNQ